MKISMIMGLLVLFLFASTPAAGQTLGPRSADDLVTLIGGFVGTAPGCGGLPNAFPVTDRALSNGTHEFNWSVPAGTKLIVTGVSWLIDSSSPGDTFWVSSRSAAGTAGTYIFSDAAPVGLAANAVELSGIAVDSGFTFCVTKSGGWTWAQLFIRGYLVEDRARRP